MLPPVRAYVPRGWADIAQFSVELDFVNARVGLVRSFVRPGTGARCRQSRYDLIQTLADRVVRRRHGWTRGRRIMVVVTSP